MALPSFFSDFPEDKKAYLQLLGASVIWGSTFIVGRMLGEAIPPMVTASLRFICAFLVLIAILLVRRQRLILPLSWAQWGRLALLSVFGIFFYSVFFFYGLTIIPGSRASLITALNPAFIAVGVCVLDRIRPKPIQILGIVCALLGAMTVIFAKDPALLRDGLATWPGDLLVFGCVISWMVYSLASREIVGAIGPLYAVTYAIFFGMILLVIATFLNGDFSQATFSKIHVPEFLGIVWLGLFGSGLAYIWYYSGIQRIGATRSSVFIALNPLSAVFFGVVFLHETMTMSIAAGGALAILGVVLSNRR